MADIERRAFIKGATLGALAFTVGGSTVMLTARQARARNVPFRLLKEDEAETIESMGETLVPGARAAGIAHFIDQQISVPPEEALLQARILNVRPPFVNFYRAAVSAIDGGSAEPVRPQVRAGCRPRPADRVRRPDAAEQGRRLAGSARRRSSTPCCAATPSTSSTARWRATRRSASRTWPISRQSGGGDMANEKVDVVIVGAGASGAVFASVLAKAGKKVVLLEAGPDWQLSDLISSEIWGRRIKPAGAPFLLEGKNPFGYAGQAGWGVGGAALHYFANLPRLLADRLQDEERAQSRATTGRSPTRTSRRSTTRSRARSASRATPRPEEKWRPAGEPYPMPPMKTFRNGEIWIEGLRGQSASAWCRRRSA